MGEAGDLLVVDRKCFRGRARLRSVGAMKCRGIVSGLAVVSCLGLLLGNTACRSTKTEAAWHSIFDGGSTNGWRMVGPGYFEFKDGELITHGGMGLFWYAKEKFGDCQIRVVFKLTGANDNSGVFIRIPDRPREPWFAVNTGYEVQIANGGDAWHRTGSIYSIAKAATDGAARVGEWNTLVITLDGPATRTELNGQTITEFTEGDPVPPKREWHEPERGPRPNRGFIGLQNHDEETHVHYREISVRPLLD